MMKRFVILLSLFAVLLSTACRPAAAPVSVSSKPVSINDRPRTNLPLPPKKPLEEMTWAAGDGKTQTLKDLQGKAVILDFWATYCPPCKEEVPHLNALLARYGADNLTIIGLNVGGEEDQPK